MSTIKVDTYQTRGGASEIAIDKLKGVTAAGSMLVVAEGGTTTTNLQQGLCKAWIHIPPDGASISDSFNVSSHDDDGAGDGGVNINNNMANDDYAITSACSDATASDQILTLELTQNSEATTAFDYETNRAGSSVNRTAIDTNRMIALFGDLA